MPDLRNKPATIERGPVEIHVLNDVTPGSIRNVAALHDVIRNMVEPLLAEHPVVAVPNGAIDRSVFPMKKLNLIPNGMLQGKMHRHVTTHLVRANDVHTGTLLTSKHSAVKALHDMLSDPSALQLLAKGVQLPHGPEGWTVENVLLASRIGIADVLPDASTLPGWLSHISTPAEAAEQAFSGFSPLVLGNPRLDNAAVWEVTRQHQLALPSSTVLNWADYDLASLRAMEIHGRDMRGGLQRPDSEQLLNAIDYDD